jgi:hypothetical protein
MQERGHALSLESITQSAAIEFKIATERRALQNRSSPPVHGESLMLSAF